MKWRPAIWQSTQSKRRQVLQAIGDRRAERAASRQPGVSRRWPDKVNMLCNLQPAILRQIKTVGNRHIQLQNTI